MPTFQIAHVNEQGQDMIFVPLDSAFGRLPGADQAAQIAELQERANSAGLSGQVVACWLELSRWHFVGPQQWNPLFRSIPVGWVEERINKTLTW